MAIDWLTDLPAAPRVAVLVGLLSVSVYKAWRCGWLNVRAFNAAHTALQIEEHLGGFESLLVSAVQLRASELSPGTSESLRDMACRRAEQAVVPLRPVDAIDYQSLRRPATIAIVLAIIIGVFAFANGPFLAAGAARIFAPWMEVRYPTRTQVDIANGDMIVREGGGVRIQACVSGVIPSGATLALRTGTGKSREHELAIADGGCEYIIESVFRGFEYRIFAGDARSGWHSVQVIASPRIERAEVSLEFPPYTRRPTKTVEALTLTVPEGTRIKWCLALDRAVSKADYNPAGGKTQVLDVSPDGRTVTMQQVATQSRAYSFSWVEREHGFSFTGPSHHLQVMPDQRPHVELTSPKGNLYATLGRKLDLAFRGRDDHGIGESVVAYRVNKTEEVKVRFSAAAPSDGSEQAIDWDYRTVLPDLAVGDTVSFVVEVTDRYPGAEGPHRVRSAARRVTFLSREDYLKHIARQKRRLLSRLRAIYREERGVHDIVRNLDPSADVFIQTCQLEAVRQDLMRERLGVLTGRMHDLMEDLAANNITDKSETATLARLHSDLQTVAEEHVGRAASALRALARVSNKAASSGGPDPVAAVHMVDSAARELGCLVLQIGFREATEVMARELHAIAETQALLRLQTIMSPGAPSDKTERLSKAQGQLARWLTRLLGATPRDKESTIEDALVAFNLSRLTKKLRSVGVDTKMLEAVALIRKSASGDSGKAPRLQAEVISSLLHAEFRLRIGSEYEALVKAGDLFGSQVNDQKKLRVEITALTDEQFKQRQAEFARAQVALQMKLQLLLMPAIPARRARLFDIDLPSPPPVEDLLSSAEGAMKQATALIGAGDRDKAVIQQQQTEASFDAMAGIVRQRIEVMAERERLGALIGAAGKHAAKIALFVERQLSLLEKTEDAADDKTDSAHLVRLQQQLADDVEKFRMGIVERNKSLATPGQDVSPLLDRLDKTVRSMTIAAAPLKDKKPAKAIDHQETAIEALENAAKLLEKQGSVLSSFAIVLADTRVALRPGPYVADIQAEQRDLVVATRKAKPADLPHYAIVQKNLVHAVNAVLNSLEALSHMVEVGTVMLFAKDDMAEASIAIQANDLEEAADAQTVVAESLQKLLVKLQAVTPQYSYMLEVTEFFQGIVSEGLVIHAEQSRLHEQLLAAADDAALAKLIDQQRELESRAKAYGSGLHKVTGQKSYGASAGHMSAAISLLKAGDKTAGLEQMKLADDTLGADMKKLLNLMDLFSYVLKPPLGSEPTPEYLLIMDVLALAAHQKVLYRKTQLASPKQAVGFEAKQIELAKRGEVLLKGIESHAKVYMSSAPSSTEALESQQKRLQDFFANSRVKIVAANKLMLDAASKLKGASAGEAIASQHKAGELLRYLLIEYINAFLVLPGPAPPDASLRPPVESLDDDLTFHSPGAISGSKPKGGRQEWQVLGRRDRAALNENFARELPLEYRAILKDYYERLAR
jgi:DNA-binding FrmR family transcriptional regulator